MFRTRSLAAAAGGLMAVSGVMITAGPGAANAVPRLRTVVLPGSAVPFTTRAKVTGNAAATGRLTVQVWLTPRTAAAERFATAVSTPGSPLFGRFLSPAAYTARFAASGPAAASVAGWLVSAGFTGVHADATRSYVRATAPVAVIDAAFKTRIRLYQPSAGASAGRYALRANASPISVPASLAGTVLGVTGLDNAAPVMTLIKGSGHDSTRCSAYYGQRVLSGPVAAFGTRRLPTQVCGYGAAQFRNAYGANFVNTGRGQTIALVELGLAPRMFRTLRDYARVNRMPAPSATRYRQVSLGRRESACGDPFNIEEQLDVEASYDMAPGASQVVMGGDSCDNGDSGLQAIFDADLAVLRGNGTRPLASVASNSWESGTESQAASLIGIEHDFLVRGAAEGVGMYFSAGDSSGVLAPANDPFAIAVGGTTLGIGRNGQRLFETGWSTLASCAEPRNSRLRWQPVVEDGATGGGPSLLWSQPAYQHGVVTARLSTPPGNGPGPVRSVPDIAADADLFTGFPVGLLARTFVEETVGGTSLAAPLVAGLVTAAEQGQRRPFGFIDPRLYHLARTRAFHDARPLTSSTPAAFRGVLTSDDCPILSASALSLRSFDTQSLEMFGYTGQVTLPGYDTMTGLGSPNGQDFISALRKLGH